MRLTAVYIPENSLPHIFGERHKGQTLNLGGQFFYTFKETSKEIKIENKTKNESFIPNFYNEGISHISTIVGQNGAGKSTLLRALNHSIDPFSKKLVQIFENETEEKIQVFNDTLKEFLCIEEIDHSIINKRPFEPLYYSPNLDYDLADAWSSIALINYFSEDFETYFLDSVSRNVSFLNDQVVESIKEVYNDFPDYNSITIKVKKHRKSFFRATHIEANFGNPNRGDALKNDLKGELSRLEDSNYGNKTYSREELIKIMKNQIGFLESESFTELFSKIWAIEEYRFSDDSGYDFIHDSTSFFKNLEVTILSYLLLGATFPQHGLGGRVNFDKIIEAKNFKERLDYFLEMYLVNEYETLTNHISKEVTIDVSNVQPIIRIIRNDSWTKLQGVDVAPIRERMISDAIGFEDIYKFYCKLEFFCKNQNVQFDGGALIFNIKNDESKLLFDELIYSYKNVLKSFPKSPVSKSLIEFSPYKKLSTGEKAILDFYASIYNYIDVNKESTHLNYEYFLLLLDEPDLGFHPIWKKKFIEAISSTLPIIFSKMTPHIYDEKDKVYKKVRETPVIQIVFTTHDPLTLSDVLNNSVVYLKKEGEYSKILKNDHVDRPQKTFGANIHELLADSFFVEDGLIGDFANQKINKTINWLNEINVKTNSEYHKLLIENIGEPIIKNKLAEMYSEKMKDDLAKRLIDEEIFRLMEKRKMMEE